MKETSRINIISIDLFRTLVNLEQTPEIIRQMFLASHFSEEESENYLRKAEEILMKRWEAAGTGNGAFLNVRRILEDTVGELFGEIHLELDVRTAADALMKAHRTGKLFEDARPFLDSIGWKYKICLSTDCDTEMLGNLTEIWAFDRIFVSEELRAYKLDPRFFEKVIDHYGVPPDHILHIGDSKSDIVTPKRLGIMTCWLNRRNQEWNQPIKADIEVKSLIEVPEILDRGQV